MIPTGTAMGWLRKTLYSSIGKKSVMALTGLALTLFLVSHLGGLASIFWSRAALTAQAARLHRLGGLLHLAELLIMLVFLIHIGLGLVLFLENRRAKPDRYAVSDRGSGFRGFRAMPYTGMILLAFLAYHLLRFRFGAPTPAGDLVATSLAQPVAGIFTLFALLALGLHLRHGLWSLCQTLGISHPKYEALLTRGAAFAGLAITAVFMAIPLLALCWPDLLS